MTSSPSDPISTGSPAASASVPPPGCPAHGAGPGGVARLYGPESSADPLGLYERLRTEHGTVAPVLLEGDVPAWLVLGYHEILHVARNPRRFSRDGRNWRDWQEGNISRTSPVAPVLAWGPDATHQDGDVHKRLRGAVHQSLERFDRRGIRRHVTRYANGLIDGFAPTGRAELLGQYAQHVPMLVLTHLFGLPEENGPRLVEASRQLLRGTEKAIAADGLIQETLRGLVEEKHGTPGADLASWLISHPAGLDDEEVCHHLRLVLIAAHETTTNLIMNTLRVVLTHPRFRGSLNGGQMTLPAAVEQVLWDDPPIGVCPGGFATYDMELGGKTVRKGDVLLLGLAAGNVDPAVRPAPGAQMHGNRSHLAFTSGPHECPGQDIGRTISGSAIETLLSRLPDIRLTVEADDLMWSASTWSRRLEALPVAFTPQSAAPPDPPAPTPRSCSTRALPAGPAGKRGAPADAPDAPDATAGARTAETAGAGGQAVSAAVRPGAATWWSAAWRRLRGRRGGEG